MYSSFTVSFCYCSQLKEIWVKSVSDSTEAKIADECIPGKPITVFTAQPHEVGSYLQTKINPLNYNALSYI